MLVKVVAGHQPNFLPYLGFFDKMRAVNELGTKRGIFVIRDDCQYGPKDFHSRNRIRTYENFLWLHVPVNQRKELLCNVKIDNEKKVNGKENWVKFHNRMLWNNYRNTPFFEKFYSGLWEIYSNPGDSLVDFNMKIIKYLANCFGIEIKFVLASELGIKGKGKSETLAEITRAVGANVYLSGPAGKNYIDTSVFQDDVSIVFQDFNHPVYPQRFPGFEPCMSAIDALFNVGYLPRSGEVILRKNVVKILHLQELPSTEKEFIPNVR